LSKRANRSVHLYCLELFAACGDENLMQPRNAKRRNAILASGTKFPPEVTISKALDLSYARGFTLSSY